jgi:hypothetical protein
MGLADQGLALLPYVIYAATLCVVGVSGYFVLRQEPRGLAGIKAPLFFIHPLGAGIIVLEILRNLLPTPSVLTVYTILATSAIFSIVGLLAYTACLLYMGLASKAHREAIPAVFRRRPFGTALLLYSAYLAFLFAYLVVYTPFTFVEVRDLSGATKLFVGFEPSYLALLLSVLSIFLAFPMPLMLVAALREPFRSARRAILILAASWVLIGGELLIFHGYLVTQGLDATSIGYVVAALAFLGTMTVFRRSTALVNFFRFAPVRREARERILPPRPAGLELSELEGRASLFEVDPLSEYERPLRELVEALLASTHVVFLFTSKGSRLYAALSGTPGVQALLMTARVSYPTPAGRAGELLVPQADRAILLDLIDKALRSNPGAKLAIIFDSISDLIVSLGLENTYKFLKQANEILSEPRVTSLFLITRGAHDERAFNLIRGLYPIRMLCDEGGIRPSRAPV